MTVEQFEKIVDYLLEVVREFGSEGANTDATLLEALEARCDYLRGEVGRKTRE